MNNFDSSRETATSEVSPPAGCEPMELKSADCDEGGSGPVR